MKVPLTLTLELFFSQFHVSLLSQVKSFGKLESKFPQVMEIDSHLICRVQMKMLSEVFCKADASGNEGKDNHLVG